MPRKKYFQEPEEQEIEMPEAVYMQDPSSRAALICVSIYVKGVEYAMTLEIPDFKGGVTASNFNSGPVREVIVKALADKFGKVNELSGRG